MPAQTIQPWTYRSPSGRVELFVDPTDPFGAGPARCRLIRAGAVAWERELPFTLVDALVSEDGAVAGFAYSEGGTRLGGELVIAVLAPDGRERVGERIQRVPGRMHGPAYPSVGRLRRVDDGFALEILDTRPGQEWIHSWKDGTRLREGPAQRPAKELARPPEIPAPAGPPLALALLGRVSFPWPGPPPAPDGRMPLEVQRKQAPHRVFVDHAGRIWISERSTHRVHVFEASGAELGVRTPGPPGLLPDRPVEWLSARDDGALFVFVDGILDEFDPAGAWARRSTLDPLGARWWFLPSSGARWEVERVCEVRLVDADGRVQRSTERVPNGRWLGGLGNSSMDLDGTLAVLDEPIGVARDPAQWIHVFGPDGSPARSLRLQWKVDWRDGAIALRAGRLALLVEGGILFLREDGSPIGMAPLPSELQEATTGFSLFFSPGGDELWVFPQMCAEMWRFEAPA